MYYRLRCTTPQSRTLHSCKDLPLEIDTAQASEQASLALALAPVLAQVAML